MDRDYFLLEPAKLKQANMAQFDPLSTGGNMHALPWEAGIGRRARRRF